ncbi:hypothetical protein [Kitasatospora sp. NPDC001175]|uniref:hypothetical protein n=1 Tax=Kitasatospora sp. NPDC001175 TaxID=3157103 RepID=UPI003D06065D
MHIRHPWFDLGRHDDPNPDTSPATDSDPDGADSLGDAGRRALDRMKAERTEAKRQHAAEKTRADELAARVAEFEDRDRTELERATAAAEAAAKRAATATARAVQAEVKALAAEDFADPSDAAAFLDLSAYASADGEINTDAIAADLTALLERKPHLGRQTAPTGPRPDLSQGARPPAPPTDFRTADRAALDAELSRHGVRLRS